MNKTTFAPGESVIVTLRGGRTTSATNGTGGWVRGILYRNNVEIARSAGTVAPGNVGPSGGSGLPITFTTAAPSTPGTYTYAAAWFGNTGNNGSTHGEVRAPAITITVAAAANQPPVLSAIGPKSVNEGSLLSFTATATDPDAGQTRTFSLDAGAPAGAAITAGGAFTWTPTEAQGPGSYPVTVRVTDNGSPAASDFETITVTVAEVNVAPVLAPIGNRTGTVGSPVTFTATATDADVPAQTRTFSLGAGAPAGATITAGGAFSWTPSAAQVGNLPVTVTVTDSGSPSLSDSEAITVTVSAATVTLSSIAITGSASVNEGATSQFTATATWSDGTTSNVTASASWTTTLGTISASGLLSAPSVTANQTTTVGASYTSGGVTRTASVSVNIVETTPPTGADVSVMPATGAVDVPVNSVVMATETGTGDIVTCFNAQTFSLRVNGSATATSTVASPGEEEEEGCVDDGVVKGAISYNASNTAGTFTPACRLMNGTAYTATIASSPGGLSVPKTWEFTTIAASPDTDGDGVPDNEDDHPGNKGKGTPPSSRGNGKFLIDVTATAGVSLADARGFAETDASLDQTGMPSGYEFRDGLVNYRVVGLIPGSTIPVKITFPSGIPAGSKVYKAGPAGFQEFGGATIDGNTVTMTITDGGAGDSDGQANGVIVDPVGVAVPATSGSGSLDLSTSAAGGGCAVAPGRTSGGAGTMAPLILLLVGVALRRMRKQGGRK